MLLIYVTMNGIQYRVSTELLTLENPFLPHIESFTSPKMNASSEHGGYCKIAYGKISFYPVFFENTWPPPKSLEMSAYYAATVEAGKQRLFLGTIFLTGVFEDKVEYNFFDVGSSVNVLETAVSYASDPEEVVLPMIFGDVEYFPVTRIPDTHTGCYTYHGAYLSSGYTIYDDGVDVTSNALTDDSWVTFYLAKAYAVGTVSVSGTSSKATTLSGFLTWGANQLSLLGTFSFLNSTTSSKEIRMEITSQVKVKDLVDQVLQEFCCLGYDNTFFMYLVDMDTTSENYTYNEYEHFNSSISHNAPIDKVNITSLTRTAKTDPVEVVEAEVITSVDSGFSYATNEINLLSQNFDILIDQINATKIIDVQGRPLLTITIPMEIPLPLPGRYLSWLSTTDTYIKDMNMNVRASQITYNFDKDEVSVQGDGFYDYVGDKIWMIPQQSTTVGEIIPMLRVNPANGNIAKHWLPAGSDTTYIDCRNGCVDDNNVLWPAPYGCSDYCSFGTETGLKEYTGHLQGVGSAFINTVNGTGTDYVFYVPYTSPDIVRMDTTSLTFVDRLHSKSVVNGAYLCGAYANDYLWLAGGSHANITRMHPTTFTLTDFAHSQGNEAYSGAVVIGTNIWWCPKKSDKVTIQDATDGSFTHYTLSVYTTDNLFNGVVYDGTDLWFLPGSASASIYKFSLTTHDITTVYSSGYANGTFNGGVYYDGYIWLAPETGDDIIKIDLSDGTVTAYPHGIEISGGSYYIGAILST